MIEANKLKLGLFIVISVSILVGGLLAFGLMDRFKQKYEFFTVFDESVQGLEKGAAIKYKGVTIGKVTKISVWKNRYVRVEMEAEPGSISEDSSSSTKSQAEKIRGYKKTLQREVEKGLRCSLEISSLATGLKFIELTHMDFTRKREVTLKEDIVDKENFIPAMKSLLSGAITNFDKTLTNIAKIDYEGIGIETKQALIHLNKLLADPKITSLISKSDAAVSEFISMTQSINTKVNILKIEELQKSALSFIDNTDKKLSKLLTDADASLNTSIPQLTKRLNASLDNFDKTVLEVQKEIKNAKIAATAEVARTALKKASASFDGVREDASLTLKKTRDFLDNLDSLKTDVAKALKSVEGAGNSLSGLRADFTATLKRFKVTLDSVSAFIDYLESDPSSLLRGKAEE
jgi:paraquat-inducible protein B